MHIEKWLLENDQSDLKGSKQQHQSWKEKISASYTLQTENHGLAQINFLLAAAMNASPTSIAGIL
jgi:hypothetical protein